MLLFHGTSGDEALIEKIFAEGLLPHPRPWAKDATGVEAHVFACTTPIGTRGGDPIQFAQRGAWRRNEAWLVVIDVPADGEVRGAVPNGELEQWWKVRAFEGVMRDPDDVRRVIQAARGTGSARELFDYRVASTAEGLCDQPDAHTLVQFERAYQRATDRRKAAVARSYGLRIPEWFASDAHYPSCAGCMHNLFVVDIVAFAGEVTFSRGAFDKLDLATFATLFDALGRWFAHHGDPVVGSWSELAARYPPPRVLVPRTFWPDFATRDLAERIRQPDTQVLLGHVPPGQILGAIHLGARDRLSRLVKPARGETLATRLAYLARELAGVRRDRGAPLILR